MNQINQIEIYRTKAGWSFDDPNVGLNAEPFVCGIPEIIDQYSKGQNRVVATFSHSIFPETDTVLTLQMEEHGGGWYKDEMNNQLGGWLCPALFKYFDTIPEEIHVKIDPIYES